MTIIHRVIIKSGKKVEKYHNFDLGKRAPKLMQKSPKVMQKFAEMCTQKEAKLCKIVQNISKPTKIMKNCVQNLKLAQLEKFR